MKAMQKKRQSVCSKISDAFVQNRQFCLLRFFPLLGYNHAIDSNGAVGHLLTRSALFVSR